VKRLHFIRFYGIRGSKFPEISTTAESLGEPRTGPFVCAVAAMLQAQAKSDSGSEKFLRKPPNFILKNP